MALTAGTLALIGLGTAAAGATVSSVGSAINNRRARNEEARSYKQAQNYLNSLYYRDPLSTVGNRALLKSMDERMEEQQKALNNRAIAGGATMENQLAARQANNETMGRVYNNLLAGEDARRDRLSQQKLGLDMQHSQNVQNSYREAAQDWQAWGSQMANAGMSLASAGLLSGYGANSTAPAAASASGNMIPQKGIIVSTTKSGEPIFV